MVQFMSSLLEKKATERKAKFAGASRNAEG
jgi:hypothetical protein